MMKLALAAIAAVGLMFAQDKPPDKPTGPVAKDQAEADLINGIMKEGDANKRLAELDEWSKKYPETEFADARPQFYLGTYIQLKKNREAFDKALEILAKHPNDYTALSSVILYGPTLNNNSPSAADQATTEKACNYIIDNAAAVFAESNKPAQIAAADWSKMQAFWDPQARHTIAALIVGRKDNEKSEAELTKMLGRWPNDSTLAQLLGQVILAQNKAHPEKQPLAMYYYARAAAWDGEGSLPEANRKSLAQGFLIRAYKTYHGSQEGFEDLMTMAKSNATPPSGFKIKSTVEIEQEKADAQAKIDAADPAMAVWRTLKDGLTGANADQFFESAKGAGFPGKDPSDKEKDMHWKGKLVSMTPAIRPKTLVIALQNPAGDVTLKVDMPLGGKMDPGAEIEFSGTMSAYTKEPYMLTLDVEKDSIVGWKPIAAPPAPKKTVPKKKAQ
jgi:hypothetical protein